MMSACSTLMEPPDGPPEKAVDIGAIPDAVPRAEPLSPHGNPTSYAIAGTRYYVQNSSAGYEERGIASWYGKKFHGRRTASGEIYDMFAMTAAHRTLPIPTYVQVTNLGNDKTVVVRVNDRGPFHGNRLIDLSYAAAVKLGMTKAGTAEVRVRAITPEGTPPAVQTSFQQQQTNGVPAKPLAEHYLQVGAFEQRDNAERLVNQLTGKTSAPVQISNAGRFFRVRIGPFTAESHARAEEAKLTELGYEGAHIIANQ
jgi:rare lipoprotein A